MENEGSLHELIRSNDNLVIAGEENRVSPRTIDFSEWLAPALRQLSIGNTRFPATFDRAVWPRPVDLDERLKPRTGNLLELSPFSACNQPPEAGEWRIAVGLLTFLGTVTRATRDLASAQKQLTEEAKGWGLLGYDVLDDGLAMSGLLNFGDLGHDVAAGQMATGAHLLNEYLLWQSPAEAIEFANRMSSLVPSHSPFEVIALFACNDY
jgi:hypothetical protein